MNLLCSKYYPINMGKGDIGTEDSSVSNLGSGDSSASTSPRGKRENDVEGVVDLQHVMKVMNELY